VLTYVLRRLLWMIPTMIGITFLAFAVMHFAPGDPAALKFQTDSGAGGGVGSEKGTIEDALTKFRKEHLLDQPIWKQYLHYIGPFDLSEQGHPWFGGTGEKSWGGLLALDLKKEFHRSHVEIKDELLLRLRVTVPLALISTLLSYLIALPLGIHSVVRRGKLDDGVATVTVFLLYSVPTFWAGLMLQLGFGKSGLDLFPILGLTDPEAEPLTGAGGVLLYTLGFGAGVAVCLAVLAGVIALLARKLPAWVTMLCVPLGLLAGGAVFGIWRSSLGSMFPAEADLGRHCVLPLAVMTYGGFAYLSRQMRAGMIETIRQDFIRTARAKGLSESSVLFKHALRNSLIPVLTLFASILPILIGGSVVVESIFELPGMGRYAFEGLLKRDYNIVMATTTLSAFLTLFGILLSDISYALADPRIRYD
jgi:peptide/nickel transport system permease protein